MFLWLRSQVEDTGWEDFFYYASDLIAWTPLFIFIGVLMTYSRPRGAGWNVFFGLGALILSIQAAQILGAILVDPAPYVVEYIRIDAVLPAYNPILSYSLPDAGCSGLAGLIVFALMRFSPNYRQIGRFLILLPFLFAIARVCSGYCYPSHALLGIILGTLVGFLLSRVIRNFEVVFIGN